MINKKVLVLATYPIKEPQHGGQKRLTAIVNMYKKNFSDVKFVSIFHKKIYKKYSHDDISLSLEAGLKAERNPLTSDIVCGKAIAEDRRVRAKVVNLLRSFNPDIIHIEQPFVYLGLKEVLNELKLQPKIVFGSQNVEGPMKREILEGAGYGDAEVNKAVSVINDVESQLSKECDLLVACTEDDLELHRKMGGARLVLAENGIARAVTTKKDVESWKRIFATNNIDNTILFVASAHPPSITGFYDMIGKGLGFVSQESRILIAGSVCDYFTENIRKDSVDIQDATFWLRAYPCGRLSEESLGALLSLSDIIVLPITEGGGSNLKTAEAILSDKRVVTTTHALRSFEWFAQFPNVWVADTKEAFCDAIQQALATPKKQRTEDEQKQASTVMWEYRLADLEKEVKAL